MISDIKEDLCMIVKELYVIRIDCGFLINQSLDPGKTENCLILQYDCYPLPLPFTLFFSLAKTDAAT